MVLPLQKNPRFNPGPASFSFSGRRIEDEGVNPEIINLQHFLQILDDLSDVIGAGDGEFHGVGA